MSDGGSSLAIGFAAAFSFALVPILFAFRDGKLAFDATLPEIKPCRNERMTLELRLSDEFADFLLVQEELSRPERIVVADVAVGIWPNMGIQQESLAIFDDSVGVFQVSLAFTDGFDFGAAERDSALVSVEEEIVMTGGAVDGRIAFPGSDWIARLLFYGRLADRMCGLTRHERGSESSC